MPTFYYKATNTSGKVETGSLEAGDKSAALRQLEKKGLFPLSVSDTQGPREIKMASFDLEKFLPSNHIGGGLILDFTDKLAALLKAGLPLAKALNLLIETTEHELMKDIIRQVLKDVSAGQTFADSLAKHPKAFERLFVNMVRTGEAAGVLEKILENLRDYLQMRQNLRSFLISAMIYPAILLFTATGTVLVLVLFVLPRFQQVFDQIGQEMPFITQVLVDFTRFISSYKYVIVPTVIIAVIAFTRWKSSPEGKFQWDTFKFRLPILGSIIQEIEVNRFSNAMGILLSSSVSLLEAMSIAKEISDNSVFRKALEPVIKGVKKGDGMAGPMAQSGIFPRMAVHLVTVGEETGKLGEIFSKISNIYQQNLEKTIKRVLAMFEPALVLVMFVVVGFIVAAMLLAVTSLSQVTI